MRKLAEIKAPLHKCGVTKQKIAQALVELERGENSNQVRNSFLFLTAVFNSFLGHRITALLPDNAKYLEKLRTRTQRFESAYLLEEGSKLSDLFTKPA